MDNSCFYCGAETILRCEQTNPLKKTRDHYIPLNVNGRRLSYNIVVSCLRCNIRKGGLLPKEYAIVCLSLDKDYHWYYQTRDIKEIKRWDKIYEIVKKTKSKQISQKRWRSILNDLS